MSWDNWGILIGIGFLIMTMYLTLAFIYSGRDWAVRPVQ
jgi:hypothetical protein